MIRRFRPDVVLDVTPYTEAHARTLVEAVRGLTERLVVLSSADVYRNYSGFRGEPDIPTDAGPLAENAPLRETLYPYRGFNLPFEWADDYDKILVERMVLNQTDLPATILRLPAVYGPGDKQHRLRPYLQRMDDERPAILLATEQAHWRWTRSHVKNVAQAIVHAVENVTAAGQIYNVGEEPPLTEHHWVQQIGAVAAWPGAIVEMPMHRLPEHLRQPYDFRYTLALDTRKIRRELGYTECVDRHQALEETIAWERRQSSVSTPETYAAEDAALAAYDAP